MCFKKVHFLIFYYCKIEINDDFQTLSLYFCSPPTPCVCYYCSSSCAALLSADIQTDRICRRIVEGSADEETWL